MVSYQILKDKMIVFIEGQLFTISKNDERFENILAKLPNVRIEDLMPNYLGNGFSYKNNALYFHKFLIPTSIEKHLKNSKTKLKYINFFLNCFNRLDTTEMTKVIDLINKNKIIPISDCGSYVFNQTEMVFDFATSLKENEDLDSNFFQNNKYFKNPQDYKKNFVKELFLKRTYNELFKYMFEISRDLELEKRIEFLNKDYEVWNHPELVKSVSKLVDLFAKKNNQIQSERASNLLNYSGFLDLLVKFKECLLSNIQFNYQNLSLPELIEIVEKEYNRLDGKALGINHFYPEVEKFDNFVFKFKTEEIKMIIPKTSRDLVVLGSKLSNCVGGYSDKCRNGSVWIAEIQKNNQTYGCIEVRHKKIIQFEIKETKKQKLTQIDPFWVKIQEIIEENI